jgi:uncharacterized protein (TIGR02246 family)
MSNDRAGEVPAIEFELDFEVPRAVLFDHWIRPEYVREWFAPQGYVTTMCRLDASPEGEWRMDFRSDAGHEYTEQGTYLLIDPPGRLEFTLTQVDGEHIGPETKVTAEFLDLGSRTRMHFRQTGFAEIAHRDQNEIGWSECFERLAASVSAGSDAEREIRDLFEAWFDASTAKDLDASMEPIADDVISYEHEVPLKYQGVDAIRPICEAGFEYQGDNFRWDIPDLQVIVRDDIAVTWGLNRMRSIETDGTARTMWSRGTRIFQRQDGRWKMIHQHVSFPFEPTTGMAVMESDPGSDQ